MQTSSIKKQTALYVYDFVSVLIVPHLLRRFGWNCITAVYKDNFLEIAAAQQPDIIILDQLSDSDLEFCRQLKNDEKTKNIRLIVVTFGDENISKAIKAGADGHLNAPVSILDFQNIIQPESFS